MTGSISSGENAAWIFDSIPRLNTEKRTPFSRETAIARRVRSMSRVGMAVLVYGGSPMTETKSSAKRS